MSVIVVVVVGEDPPPMVMVIFACLVRTVPFSQFTVAVRSILWLYEVD